MGGLSELAYLIPIIVLFAGLILTDFFCAVFFDIMVTSASGTDDCQGFPSFTDLLNDLIMPFLKVVGAVLVSFFPYFLLLDLMEESVAKTALSYLLIAFGIAYFPMAILAIGILHTFLAFSPHIVLPAIKNAGGLYWIIVAILLLVYILEVVVLGSFGNIFLIGSIVTAFIATAPTS